MDDAVGQVPITRLLRCSGCGYSLRGHAEEGRCPECGLPIATTIARHRAALDRRALWRSSWSDVRVAIFGLYADPPLADEGRIRLLAIAAGAAGLTLVQLAVPLLVPHYPKLTTHPTLTGLYYAYLCLGASYAASMLLIAVPLRTRERTRLAAGAVWFIRLSAAAPIGATLFPLLAETTVPWYWADELDDLTSLSFVVLKVGTCLLFDRLACFAARLPSPWLARYFKLCMYVTAFVGSAFFAVPAYVGGFAGVLLAALSCAVLTGFAFAVWRSRTRHGGPARSTGESDVVV